MSAARVVKTSLLGPCHLVAFSFLEVDSHTPLKEIAPTGRQEPSHLGAEQVKIQLESLEAPWEVDYTPVLLVNLNHWMVRMQSEVRH